MYLVGSDPHGRLSFYERIFERAMGIVGNAQRMFMGGLYQLWRFENILRTNDGQRQVRQVLCAAQRQAIGDLDIHELGIRKDGKVVFVNTKYSCLCGRTSTHSFKAIWKPKFISKHGAGGPVPPERPGDERRRAEVRHRGVQARHDRRLARPPP